VRAKCEVISSSVNQANLTCSIPSALKMRSCLVPPILLLPYLLWILEDCHGFSTVSQTQGASLRLSSTSSHSSSHSSRVTYSYKATILPTYTTQLFMSEDETPDDKALLDDKIFQRQDRLEAGYQITSLVFAGTGLLHLVRKGLNFWALYYALCGPGLVAGVSYILKDAASNDRLASDTSKRLNLSLLAYGVLGLSLPVLDREHFLVPFFIAPPLLATINAIKGYGYGVLGWDKSKHVCAVFPDLQEGFTSTFKSLTKFRKESLDYLLMTTMVVAMTAVKLKETVELLLNSGGETASPLMLASRVSRLARLILFSGVLWSLKDAADRDRLSDTAFVQLNYLSSVAFFSMAGYLCPKVLRPSALGILALVFSGITAYNGYSKSQKADF
jgi:hypothetical protein